VPTGRQAFAGMTRYKMDKYNYKKVKENWSVFVNQPVGGYGETRVNNINYG